MHLSSRDNREFMIMLMIAMVFGCLSGGGEATSNEPMAAMEWSEGMWQGFAMTVSSGVSDAVDLATREGREAGRELLVSVYKGSFEPELEVAIRGQIGAHRALELELAFEELRVALGRRNADEKMAALLDSLAETSRELDELGAGLD